MSAQDGAHRPIVEEAMTIKSFGRLVGALALALGLAGCIDATMEVEVTSEATARGTMIQVMDKAIYDMVEQGRKSGAASTESDFCDDGKLTLEGEKAICTVVRQGPFSAVTFDAEGTASVAFSAAGPGLVRVAFPSAALKKQVGAGREDMDPETRAMLVQFFTGHALTLKVSGGDILETNMTIAVDGKSASASIPFLALIDGKIHLPDALYAIVKK
jgi:hypothetical protein